MVAQAKHCERCPAWPDCPFCGLSGDARAAFEAVMEVRSCAAGFRLIEQGERPEGLFLVRQGLVELHHDGDDGHRHILGLVGAAGLIGLGEAMIGGRSRLSAVAVRATTVEVVPRRELARFLVDHPSALVPLLVWESEELERRTEALLEERQAGLLPDRLLRRLRRLGELCGRPVDGGVFIDLPLSVRHLGDTLGCSRQWASKLLSDAESAGLVERRGKGILLTGAGLAGAPTSTG